MSKRKWTSEDTGWLVFIVLVILFIIWGGSQPNNPSPYVSVDNPSYYRQ